MSAPTQRMGGGHPSYAPEPLLEAIALGGRAVYVPDASTVADAHSWLVRGVAPRDPRPTVRGSLDDALPDLESLVWLRLAEVASSSSNQETSTLTTAGLSMLATIGRPVVVVVGAETDTPPSVCLGLAADPTVLDSWLANQAPDLVWVPSPAPEALMVAATPHRQTALSCRARGVPAPERSTPDSDLDRLPSALQLLLHSAAALPRWCVVATLRPIHPTEWGPLPSAVATTAHSFARAVNVSDSNKQTRSSSGVDVLAQQVVDTVDAWGATLDDIETGGGWDLALHCCAPSELELRILVGLVQQLLSPRCARSQRSRTWSWSIDPVEAGGPVGGSWLSSRDVADLLLPVSTSVGSIQVREPLPGGRQVLAHHAALTLGAWVGTRIPASIDRSDLAGHAFITGMTGSGKSTSTRRLLTQAWNDHGIPWLVIDPAKADYPAIGPLLEGGLTVVDGNRLSMNALAPWPGTSPGQHVTAVAAAFRSAFGLPMPVPYVATLLFDEVSHVEGVTLHDVAARLPSLISELGYRGEIEDNIKASLGLRLRLLTQPGRAERLAGAGPPTWLTERPTVVQLGDLADDEERSFIAALLVTWVAEAARIRGESSDVRHLTVVEEAHRLMPEPRPTSGEDGDAGAVSARLMTQLLAEIRSYGESMLVIDQSPAAVAREVLRNTNVKLVHRVVDRDDQSALGGALGLTEEDSRTLGSLAVGRALLSTRDLARPQALSVQALSVGSVDSGTGVSAPRAGAEVACHGPGGEVAHHRSERLGQAMELEVALWALSGGATELLARARTKVAEHPGSSVGCLVAVGIRRHVATLARLAQVPEGGQAEQAAEWWSAAMRGRRLTSHPGDAGPAPMPVCQRCPAPCRARGLVSSGALTGMPGHRAAVRGVNFPQDVAEIATDVMGAYTTELAPLAGQDAALMVGFCAGAHLAHEAGASQAWLGSDRDDPGETPQDVGASGAVRTEEDNKEDVPWQRTNQ